MKHNLVSKASGMFGHTLLAHCSLRSTKLQSVKSPAEKGNLEAAVEPYRSDNAKLVKENNELHQQLIKVQEELEVSSKGKIRSYTN